MTNYRPGDKVRCIAPIIYKDMENGFTLGNVYTVKNIGYDGGYDSGYVLLIEEDDNKSKTNGWCLSYFEPAYIKEFNNKLEDIINE